MFNRIARLYDPLNTIMTAGLHHDWRRRAADLASIESGSRVLDVAAGTGDLTIELAERVKPHGEAIGCDFSDGMLDRARAKAPSVRFEQGDALNLKYADDEFDAATVAFGARNFAHVGQGLREMVRVVRPGGRVVILDFTTPSKPPLSTFFGVWFDQVVPMIGRAARQREAYEYLSRSVRRYPPPVEIAAEMASSGMRDVRFIVTAGGIVTLHVGTVED